MRKISLIRGGVAEEMGFIALRERFQLLLERKSILIFLRIRIGYMIHSFIVQYIFEILLKQNN